METIAHLLDPADMTCVWSAWCLLHQQFPNSPNKSADSNFSEKGWWCLADADINQITSIYDLFMYMEKDNKAKTLVWSDNLNMVWQSVKKKPLVSYDFLSAGYPNLLQPAGAHVNTVAESSLQSFQFNPVFNGRVPSAFDLD